MINLTCEHCGEVHEVDEKYIGQKETCKKCGGLIAITGPASQLGCSPGESGTAPDDLFDVSGAPSAPGKPTRSDLAEKIGLIAPTGPLPVRLPDSLGYAVFLHNLAEDLLTATREGDARRVQKIRADHPKAAMEAVGQLLRKGHGTEVLEFMDKITRDELASPGAQDDPV